jgi:hypothetical protein
VQVGPPDHVEQDQRADLGFLAEHDGVAVAGDEALAAE